MTYSIKFTISIVKRNEPKSNSDDPRRKPLWQTLYHKISNSNLLKCLWRSTAFNPISNIKWKSAKIEICDLIMIKYEHKDQFLIESI